MATLIVVRRDATAPFQHLEPWARSPGSDLTLIVDRRRSDRATIRRLKFSRAANGRMPSVRRLRADRSHAGTTARRAAPTRAEYLGHTGSPGGALPGQQHGMTPPTWLDASGRRRPTLACWTCGRKVTPMRFRSADLRPHGGRPPQTLQTDLLPGSTYGGTSPPRKCSLNLF